MSTIFIIFFISLLGIVVMVARKLAPIRAGKIANSVSQEFVHPFVPDLVKARNFTYKNIKKYEHLALVTTLRFYVKSVNILKARYEELKKKIGNGENSQGAENKEANRFLKMISDYKHRIRHIKTKIEEEEVE